MAIRGYRSSIRRDVYKRQSQRLVRRINSTTNSYQGRLGLFEYVEIPCSDIDWNHVDTYLYVSLQDSAQTAINSGITTVEEVHRAGILL